MGLTVHTIKKIKLWNSPLNYLTAHTRISRNVLLNNGFTITKYKVILQIFSKVTRIWMFAEHKKSKELKTVRSFTFTV